jgi:hypothetical protein
VEEMSENCNCKNCEAMKIILRLQYNLHKRDATSELSELLDAAIKDSLYVPG